MGHYWRTVLSKAFWDSLQLFYDRPSLLSLSILGAAVTALLVWLFRGKEAFVEHVKANILIVVAGGVLTWILVLPYFILRAPFDLSSDMQSDLQRSRERERASAIQKQTVEAQLESAKCPAILRRLILGICVVPLNLNVKFRGC